MFLISFEQAVCGSNVVYMLVYCMHVGMHSGIKIRLSKDCADDGKNEEEAYRSVSYQPGSALPGTFASIAIHSFGIDSAPMF